MNKYIIGIVATMAFSGAAIACDICNAHKSMIMNGSNVKNQTTMRIDKNINALKIKQKEIINLRTQKEDLLKSLEESKLAEKKAIKLAKAKAKADKKAHDIAKAKAKAEKELKR